MHGVSSTGSHGHQGYLAEYVRSIRDATYSGTWALAFGCGHGHLAGVQSSAVTDGLWAPRDIAIGPWCDCGRSLGSRCTGFVEGSAAAPST